MNSRNLLRLTQYARVDRNKLKLAMALERKRMKFTVDGQVFTVRFKEEVFTVFVKAKNQKNNFEDRAIRILGPECMVYTGKRWELVNILEEITRDLTEEIKYDRFTVPRGRKKRSNGYVLQQGHENETDS